MSNMRHRGNLGHVLALAHATPFGHQRSAYAHNVGGSCPSDCPPRPRPTLQRSADGCTTGRLQCRMPVAVRSGEIAAGDTATFTVVPRSPGRPDELLYLGTEGGFTIESVMIDGSEQQDGDTPADAYGSLVTGGPAARAVDWPEVGPNQAVTFRVRNDGDLADTFIAVLYNLTARRI